MLISRGFTEKSNFRGGGFTKNQYIGGELPKKGEGTWTVCRFKGWGERLGEKERGGVFEGVYPNAHYKRSNAWKKALEV